MTFDRGERRRGVRARVEMIESVVVVEEGGRLKT